MSVVLYAEEICIRNIIRLFVIRFWTQNISADQNKENISSISIYYAAELFFKSISCRVSYGS